MSDKLKSLRFYGQQGVENTTMTNETYDDNRVAFLSMTQEYFEKFPEVENKMEVFKKSELTDQDKIEQFLIYAYWYFDEYYSMTLRLSQDKDENQFEKIIDELWFETKYQFDFLLQISNLYKKDVPNVLSRIF